ncbi:MAG TPA: DNA-binding domain-containing protein [Myxococcota bacterium]|nr:DNA-binding domain-containing protein [Myxococcota bacterium]
MLDATQRRLRHLLTSPEGVAAALREAGAPDDRSLAGFVVSDGRLDAASRLEVYANAYFARLHAVLCDDFGALAAALGDEWMNDVVAAYLLACPPRRPSIRHAGERLADFLAAHPAALPFRRRFPWCADLARLEHALCDAFDAADARPRTRESLAALLPDAWPALRLPLAPCARVLRLEWNVVPLREAYERDETPAAPPAAPQANAALVWRRDELVRFRALDPLEAALLERAAAGESFEALCAAAAREVGDAEAPARAAQLLAGWIDAGLIAA